MKIGITGANGFIGSHLVRHLAKEGHLIVAFGRSKKPEEVLRRFGTYRQWDIREKISLQKEKLDVLIHCGGFTEYWGAEKEIHETNVLGAINVLEAAKTVKHFIYISSASVYASNDGIKNAGESDALPTEFINTYAKSKVDAERAIIEFSKKMKRVTILRPHAVYGPGDKHVFLRLLKSVKHNKAFIIGQGENKISITHVGNICYGISLLLQNKKTGFKIYNIADSETITIKELYKIFFKTLRPDVTFITVPYPLAYGIGYGLETMYKKLQIKKPPLFSQDIVKQFVHESTVSLDKIYKDLSYNPQYSCNNGFEDYKKWIESIGGLSQYLKKEHMDSWQGKLFTY